MKRVLRGLWIALWTAYGMVTGVAGLLFLLTVDAGWLYRLVFFLTYLVGGALTTGASWWGGCEAEVSKQGSAAFFNLPTASIDGHVSSTTVSGTYYTSDTHRNQPPDSKDAR
jgi:hypothetical protein